MIAGLSQTRHSQAIIVCVPLMTTNGDSIRLTQATRGKEVTPLTKRPTGQFHCPPVGTSTNRQRAELLVLDKVVCSACSETLVADTHLGGWQMLRRKILVVVVTALVLGGYVSVAGADSIPSGERSFHQATIEPAYNAANAGQIGYLLTPNKAPTKAPPVAWAPIYVPVYPVGTTAATTFLCMHTPVENCPSHGDGVAGAAQAIRPDVYGDGVLGHDHVLDFPSGDDFHFAWEPVLVLFTSKAAANVHLLTDAAILAARDNGSVILVPVPPSTFNCAVVSSAIWAHATPIV